MEEFCTILALINMSTAILENFPKFCLNYIRTLINMTRNAIWENFPCMELISICKYHHYHARIIWHFLHIYITDTPEFLFPVKTLGSNLQGYQYPLYISSIRHSDFHQWYISLFAFILVHGVWSFTANHKWRMHEIYINIDRIVWEILSKFHPRLI